MSPFRHGMPARSAFRGAHPLSLGGFPHVDILRAGSLEALWFSTVRVPAWLGGSAGSEVDNRHGSHSKPCVLQR
ncbi:hypothetical protein [Burkholderia cepacia]|uniref:hypothetical protein n=1 Tax=Burkholderia cepacia TaxID=292 RepID=UPI0012D9DE59|nr:hypothetical protein [Burkholderia cepacia]